MLALAGTSWFFLLMMNGSIFGLVGVLFYLSIFVSRKVRQKRAIAKNQVAVNLLNDMRYDDASLIFEELTKSEQNTSSHSVYIFNRGVAYLLSGLHLRAFSLFNSVVKTNVFSGAGAYEPILYSDMATCLLLDDRIDEARAYLSNADITARKEDQGYLVFVRALYSLKNEQADLAFNDILESWQIAEAKLRLPFRRALSLLLAYAAERTDRCEHISPVLSQIQFSPKSLQEFHWIARNWPSMNDFMQRQLQK